MPLHAGFFLYQWLFGKGENFYGDSKLKEEVDRKVRAENFTSTKVFISSSCVWTFADLHKKFLAEFFLAEESEEKISNYWMKILKKDLIKSS